MILLHVTKAQESAACLFSQKHDTSSLLSDIIRYSRDIFVTQLKMCES